MSNENEKQAALEMTRAPTNRKPWTYSHSVGLPARLPWNAAKPEDAFHTAYEGDYIIGAKRKFNAVEYKFEGVRRKGILNMILQTNRNGETVKVTVIRRLKPFPPSGPLVSFHIYVK